MIAMMLALALIGVPQDGRADLTTPDVINPSWVRRPGTPDYPDLALILSVEGRVVLECVVTEAGRLEQCGVHEEIPAGLGFAQAAVTTTDQGRLTPRSENGVATKSRVRIPYNFALPPQDPAPEPYAGVEPSADYLRRMRAVVLASGPELTAAPTLALLPPERAAEVQALYEAVWWDQHDRVLDALVLGLARLYPQDRLHALEAAPASAAETLGSFMAANTSEAEAASAFDQLRAAGLEAEAELRRRYCARFDCTDAARAP